MVKNMTTGLHVLHEVLVAARNIGLAEGDSRAVLDIVDSVEMLPLWMADPNVDRSDEIIGVIEGLAAQYPECRHAASRARSLNG